jgi:hypothetical protein
VTGLDASQRAGLERLIVRARSLLEQDLADQAEGRYGINRDGTIEDEVALHLDPSALADRREIVAIVEHLLNEGESVTGAVARLIREATFTHLNRLVAIRIAEAMGLVPPSLAEGRASQGFREMLEVAPLVAGDETGGYWTYLRLCGDEMASDAPVLFDPRNPLLTLSPSVAALDGLVTLFSDPTAQEIWTASDTFGWAYQFFNTGDERRQMREESAAPRNSRELAVRNQFFTPRYVVDFLVQNTLGRRLLEAQTDSALIDALPLLVDPPTEQGEPLPLDSVRILDPACGSGHFLLGCYDLLERAWQLQGVGPAEAAPLIVPTLWGIDIDPRCSQVASAAIVFRARRHCRELPLPRPKVITARALPEGSDSWEQLLASLPSDRRELVQRMREALAQAPVLGPLLKAEERLDAEIRRHFTGSEMAEGTLAEGIAPDAFGEVESEVLGVLQRAADSASSSPAERLLAAEAGDAIRFVDAMRQRYDVVVMNPPFGAPALGTADYLRAAYPWAPATVDLFAVFTGRGLELCNKSGYLGAITSRVGLFLSTFQSWRTEILLGHRLTALADLGLGVMEQALVEAAAYVVGARRASGDETATFIRLLRDVDRPSALVVAISAERDGRPDHRLFQTKLGDIAAIPGAPVAYWMSNSIRSLFERFHELQHSAAEVKAGLSTGDDFRFIRCAWEVKSLDIYDHRTNTGRWARFVKGGEYSPFWADAQLLVDWGANGRNILQAGAPGTRVQNSDYYFRPGITWPRRTASGFGPRVLPEGCIFADKGPTAFAREADTATLLGWLTTRLAAALLASMLAAGDETTSGTASKSYEVGLVRRLPWPDVWNQTHGDTVRKVVSEIVDRVSRRDSGDETAARFVCPSILSQPNGTLLDRVHSALDRYYVDCVRTIEGSFTVERGLSECLDLQPDDLRYLDEEVGPHPSSYSREPLENEGQFVGLFEASIDRVIAELIREKGGSRAIATLTFTADRRLEVLSHGLDRHPETIVDARRRLRVLPPEEPRQSLAGLFSYLCGVALGRWDARSGKDSASARPLPGAFDPLPSFPPGMLLGDDGMPAIETPTGYPLEVPSAGLLVDEAGHAADIEAAILRAAAFLFDDVETTMAEMLQILRRNSVRAYLRKQFFRDHLARYSKSRRRAPIYWELGVKSRNWGVWVYAPRLSRETLFAIAGEAARREALAKEAIRRLETERDAGGTGRSAREITEVLTAEEVLAEELGAFKAEAERIAGIGWEPDLDDGMILCAAALASLFPAWADAANEREQIRNGEYPWAAVSRWKDAL